MDFRLILSRRARFALVQVGLIVVVLLTGNLVHRQSLLLPETSAAPIRTPGREFAPLATPEGPTPTPGRAVAPPTAPRAQIIDDERFFYAEDFYAQQIQQFLDTQPGPLKSFRAVLGDREQSFAEILSSRTILYSLNPQVVLDLIEQQSWLITRADTTP